MTPCTNRAISASAGTGKTFRLAHRYIGLLAAGIPPDRICALTFSRKAAAEIFDKIVDQLGAAATDPARRRQTAALIRHEGFPPPPDDDAFPLSLLRTLIDASHRLRIGTLDSFILGIVRMFPLELGIPVEAQPIDNDGGEAQSRRRQILLSLFRPTTAIQKADDRLPSVVLEAFHQARHGEAAKKLADTFDQMIGQHEACYREHPPEVWRWGAVDALIPPAQQWWKPVATAPLPDDETLAGAVDASLAHADIPEALVAEYQSIFRNLLVGSASDDTGLRQRTLFKRILEQAQSEAPPEIIYKRRTHRPPPELWACLRVLLARLITNHLRDLAEQTRGLARVMQIYAARYAERVSLDGRLTFEDLSRLLGPDGRQPSRQSAQAADNRLYIDFRLDGRLDHWLLDEFQDTSDAQWNALSNLIDEVMQDETRSFFYVGDVKQSIYGWRGGNHRLFHDILDHYRDLDTRAIVNEPMSRCFRSLPAVVEAVNHVFDGLEQKGAELEAAGGPRAAALDDFMANWERHESARVEEGPGYAALFEYHEADSATTDAAPDEPAADPMFTGTAKILRDVDPTRRGLTAAVLVRNNDDGRACVDALRHALPGVPVVHEGTGGITDNPVVQVLLALLRHAAHPGDRVSLRHLQMSPLATDPDVGDPLRLPGRVLAAVHHTGVAGTLRDWGGRLGPLDAFGSQRLHQLLAAAEAFDATGSCDLDAFADAIAAHQVKSGATTGAIRVMTIHQSKGLGFDVVIVPFAKNTRSFGNPVRPDLIAGRDWVFKPIQTDLVPLIGGNVADALEAERAQANFAQLCVLYVSLTRAERALYLLIPEPPKSKGGAFREADLLRRRLADGHAKPAAPGGGTLSLLRAFGNADAFEGSPPPPTTGREPVPAPAPLPVASTTIIPRREPSKDRDESRPFPAHWLFSAEAGDVLAFGSAIHRLFERVEWLEEADVEALVDDWRQQSPEAPALLAEVEAQFRNCLAADAIRSALSRPAQAAQAEVWREIPFQLVLEEDGRRVLTSGRFDRVVIARDADGVAVHATVYDYKSNRIHTHAEMAAAADGYATQMRHYARAAARLLNLPTTQVSTRILFTRKGWITGMLGVNNDNRSR